MDKITHQVRAEYKSISLPDIQVYAAGLMGWHPL